MAAAETLTGGILSARMTALDPALETFRGAAVSADVWGRDGLAPEGRAAAAAAEARSRFGASVGVAAIAPDVAEGFAPGTVFLHADIDGVENGQKLALTPDRVRMREFSVISLLDLLRRRLAH
jgi:nicotinamide-nucleotide amidase